jgi:DNA invertase Pin-like site-specific DNA recombinase
VPAPAPAAQYVRMSDEAQQYSIDNQKAAIQEYADLHGFVVVRTYADSGKSGVIATNRTALRELLKDVVSGSANYKAILVYDVSRWGRFQDTDEAAHYEFICSKAGIPLHYCAEQFTNDGAVSSSLLKTLKRSMAAEFSRELGEKVFRGKSRLAQTGYWMGGQAGYGYQRLMISAEGRPKQLMKCGEQKSFTTDRVILVPGPKHEVQCIKKIFAMVLKGTRCSDIARELNRQGITINGEPWDYQNIFDIVTNPKYAGCNVWHRVTERLHTNVRNVEPHNWITKPGAFEAIIDQQTFDRAQAVIRRLVLWSNDAILEKLRSLLAKKGRLSHTLIVQTKGMPSVGTLRNHFGSCRRACEEAGYENSDKVIFSREQAQRTLRLRAALANQIKEMFPKHI